MVNYKEILRLAHEGYSQRQIATNIGNSRNTVSEVLDAAKAANIAWPPEETVTNEQLGAILFPNRHTEMAEYYNTAIVPARVEHPKDKSHAEATVRLASTWILAALRNEHFFSLAEAGEAVKVKLEEMNARPFTAKEGCRRTVYLEEEKAFMKPLPVQRYELATWNPNITVGTDYLQCSWRSGVPQVFVCTVYPNARTAR